MKRFIMVLAMGIVTIGTLVGAGESINMQRRRDELKNLKWGMFICWSFSTFSGKEWTPGIKDVSFFRVTESDTDQWARTAKEAGMGYNHGDQEGADIRLGEMGRPGPLADHKAAGPHMRSAPSRSYLLAEFTYPILPPHKGGAMWFYSLPQHDNLCHTAEKLYADYLGAVKFGNIFSLDVGPDYNGRLRKIDVETLQKVGQMIRNPPPVGK
jgi:hypothetical protein